MRWRSPAANATYTVSVTSSGWGVGKTLATGAVTPQQEQQVTLKRTDFYDGDNRLWLRVTDDTGRTGALSHRLQLHRRATPTLVSPPGGVFGTSQTFPEHDTVATIYYTTDGSEPTPATATTYRQPFTLKESTTLRFMSEDTDGNREPVRQARFDIVANAATLTLLTPLPPTISGALPLVLQWQSDRDGSYEVVLQHQHEDWQRTIQQGGVTTEKAVQSAIASHFLSPGDWFIDLPSDRTPVKWGRFGYPFKLYLRYV